jgi:hypothetical protein
MNRHTFCGHETLQEATICMSCNPKRLSECEFRACLGAMIDPRKVTPSMARTLSELADLAAEAKKGE